MASKKRELREAYRALARARSYDAWREAAKRVDVLEEADAWREEPTSPDYDCELITEQLYAMRRCREERDLSALRDLLEESLHRNLGDLANPALYTYAYTGTKHRIEEYLSEVETTLNWLCDTPLPGYPDPLKLKMAREASRVFGRSALLLSGGGALGLFHLGVVKAMWEQGLLPSVISGASMGAIVAGGVCVRNDTELADMWNRVDSIHRRAVRVLPLTRAWKEGCLLAPEQLYEHVETNLGDYTFLEAYERSGRILNVAVSPTRHRQKPRLLSVTTAPDVLINHATVASCSIPGLFPPAQLYRRHPDGTTVPYADGEAWLDGSLHGDVPTMRLGRLHNVNHVIVSQANVHVVPFAKMERGRGVLPALADIATSGVRAQSRQLLGLARRRLEGGALWRPTFEWVHSLAHQNYNGDINIHPRLRVRDYARVMKNPSLSELEGFIRGGEQATWPRLEMIRNQTRVSRVIDACIKRLVARMKDA